MTSQQAETWFDYMAGKLTAVDHAMFLLLQVSITQNKQREHFIRLVEETIAKTKSTWTDHSSLPSYLRTMDEYLKLVQNMERE